MAYQSIGELASKKGAGARNESLLIFSVRKISNSEKKQLHIHMSKELLEMLEARVGDFADLSFDNTTNQWKISVSSKDDFGFRIYATNKKSISGSIRTVIQPSFPVFSTLPVGTRLKCKKESIIKGNKEIEFILE